MVDIIEKVINETKEEAQNCTFSSLVYLFVVIFSIVTNIKSQLFF